MFDFWLTSLTFNWMVSKINSLNELRKLGNTVKVKRAKSKETGWTNKARSLSHWELGYQSSLECLLADIGIKLISCQFWSWIKFGFRIQPKLHAELEHFLTLKQNRIEKIWSIYLFLFQSRCASIPMLMILTVNIANCGYLASFKLLSVIFTWNSKILEVLNFSSHWKENAYVIAPSGLTCFFFNFLAKILLTAKNSYSQKTLKPGGTFTKIESLHIFQVWFDLMLFWFPYMLNVAEFGSISWWTPFCWLTLK